MSIQYIALLTGIIVSRSCAAVWGILRMETLYILKSLGTEGLPGTLKPSTSKHFGVSRVQNSNMRRRPMHHPHRRFRVDPWLRNGQRVLRKRRCLSVSGPGYVLGAE